MYSISIHPKVVLINQNKHNFLMKKQISIEKKFADRESVFYSINNSQNDDLKDLIEGLRNRIGVITPGEA